MSFIINSRILKANLSWTRKKIRIRVMQKFDKIECRQIKSE